MAESLKSYPPAAIHIDLDGASAIYAAHGWSFPHEKDPLFESGLQNALEFLDRSELKATLFVIAQDLQDIRKRELIEEAVNRGHEIASHSVTHRKLSAIDLENKRIEIFKSREVLETELGVEVRGFRAPSFDIDQEALKLVADAGYIYDSSSFPRTVTSNKVSESKFENYFFCPLDNSQLIELSLPVYAPLPWPFHPSYSLVLGTWYFRTGLRRFRRMGAPFVLLFHLTDFADPLPAEQLQSWRTKLYTLSFMSSERKLHSCEQMLELVRNEYQILDNSQLLLQQSDLHITKQESDKYYESHLTES